MHLTAEDVRDRKLCLQILVNGYSPFEPILEANTEQGWVRYELQDDHGRSMVGTFIGGEDLTDVSIVTAKFYGNIGVIYGEWREGEFVPSGENVRWPRPKIRLSPSGLVAE